MERRVVIHPNQQITDTDLNNMGEFARTSIDHVVQDGISALRKFAGFPVVQTGPLEVTVGEGRYYNQGAVFYRDDDGGVVLSLADYIPAVTKRIVSIVVWGNLAETAVQPRTFLVDAETGQTEAEAVATESRRHAEINLVPGTENANPLPPALDANVIAIAHVTLTPSGIAEIEMVDINRLPSVQGNHQRLNENDAWRLQTGTMLDTMRTDIANLGARVVGTVRAEELVPMGMDIARLKELMDLSDDLSAYGADHFLDLEETDAENPDLLAHIEEGIRFAFAQERVANIQLLNPLEDRVRKTGEVTLPAWTPDARISITGRDGEIPITQYQIQSVETRQLTRSRERVRYGPYQTVCTNAHWWKSGRYDIATGLFHRDGEVYEVQNEKGRLEANGLTHWVRVRQIFVDKYEEAYWDRIVNTETINGAVIGQTFLNSQDGWLTEVDLFFTQVAGSGAVNVLITDTNAGAPDVNQVIAHVTVDQGDLKTWPEATTVSIPPTYLKKGKRYAVLLITQGAHMVAYVQGNKFAQGSLFYSTDGAWFQGDLLRDISMVIKFAEFSTPRVEVQIQPFELANGIANIDILSESFTPEGTELIWEVQVNGVWRPIQYYEENILVGLPALLPARIVFVGTTDLMPCITLGAASTVRTWRARTDFKHISTERTIGTDVDLIEVRLRLEAWDSGHHTVVCKLLTGATFNTEVEPESFEDRTTDDPEAIERRFFFELDTPVQSYKIQIEGTTDNALLTYHVAERVDMARLDPGA